MNRRDGRMNPSHSRLCRCDGWWEQEWYGRQEMENLRISFEERRIDGSGSDIVGPFLLSGIINADGTVVIQKRYIGQHQVDYIGTFDGEGVMSGEWRISTSHGPWMIRIRNLESDSVPEISEVVPNLGNQG